MFNYIAFEGIDGVGKTTLAKAFSKLLEENGLPTMYTFEPFGMKQEPTQMDDDVIMMSQLRTFALDKRYEDMPSIARELILLANRSIHHQWLLSKVGCRILITDRCFISGLIYKNMAENTMSDFTWWEIVNKICMKPKLVVYVSSLTPKANNDENHFYDSKDKRFFTELENKYLTELMENPIISKIPMINFKNDFNKTPEQNAQELFEYVKEFYQTVVKNANS